MADFAVVITYTDENAPHRIVLVNVESNSVTEQSEITSQPLVNGDMASDHMYNLPESMSISGKIAINGNYGFSIDGTIRTFSEIQKLFKKIRKNGLLCNIVKMKISTTNSSIGFAIHENMSLLRTTWTEGINTLGYNMEFTQVLYSNIQTYEVTIDDQYAPNITGMQSTNFTDDLLNWEMIDAAIISTGVELGFIKENFLTFLQSWGAGAIGGALVGILAVLAVGAVAGPIGWVADLVIIGVGIGVGAIYGVINGIIKIVENNKFKVKAFELYNDDKKNQQEVERFENFIGSIHQQLAQLNENILSYKIVSNEDQEATLSIDGNYYVFKFNKNQVTQRPSLVVEDINRNQIATRANITCVPFDFCTCNEMNCLFRVPVTGSYVYLLKSADPNADFSDLTNYYVVVSKVNPKLFNDMIIEIIKNAILR